jgi:carbonic anhydrase
MIRPTFRSSTYRPAIGLTALAITALLSGCSTTSPAAEGPAASSSPSRVAPAPASPTPSPVSSAPSASTAPASHWAYTGEEGPDRWGELASSFSTCGTGTAQSPVDLPSTAEPEDDDLVLAYSPVDEEAVDTGHTLQLNAQPGAGLTYGGVEYALQQVHYHDPSEHTIDGLNAPVEFHFVNRDAEGNLLVLGVLGVQGEHNEAFEPLVGAATAGVMPAASTVDVPAMMPSSLHHFAYEGSLTTPPCTEGVQWLVFDTPVQLGQDQIETLEARYDDNNRPIQPLNDRKIQVADQ